MSLSLRGLLVILSLLPLACSAGRDGGRRDSGPRPDGGPPPAACLRGGPEVVCMGDQELRCNPDGTEQSRVSCSAMGQVCAPDLGCRACYPGRGSCDGATTLLCRPDGTGFDPGVTCDASIGESCSPSLGACVSLCGEAAASNSYIGCEYWPTPVMNSEIADEFEFAVVIA